MSLENDAVAQLLKMVTKQLDVIQNLSSAFYEYTTTGNKDKALQDIQELQDEIEPIKQAINALSAPPTLH